MIAKVVYKANIINLIANKIRMKAIMLSHNLVLGLIDLFFLFLLNYQDHLNQIYKYDFRSVYYSLIY